MKNKYAVIFLLASFIYFPVSAQRAKLTFNSINTIGISDGQSGVHFLLQTINGGAFGKWFTGIGLGADYYGYKSYPLFIDARRYFARKNKWFAYTDLGYNLSGKNTPGKEMNYNDAGARFTGGVYTDLGLGYKMKLAARAAIILSAGYSYKEMNSKVGTENECLVAPCPVDYSTYRYGNGRIVLKAGVDF